MMTELNELISMFKAFENYLGNPFNPTSLITAQAILYSDELEQLNEEHLAVIKNWGYFDFFIPHTLDGKFNSLQAIYLLTKVLARRDLTLTIALNLNFLASLPIWIAAHDSLKQQHAQKMREGKIFALALTEREHGSDLAASEFSAKKNNDEWILTGEKWCINYGSKSDTITVLCKTNEHGGPLGFSLFYIDKQQLSEGFTPLNKLHTYGVRGLDISGFQLEKAKLPESALIGNKGIGLNITYKTLQMSRVLCSSLAVGAADTVLRLALQFSVERQLYNNKVFDIPVVAQRLTECFCLQLIQDTVAFSIVRAASVIPENLALWSALVKYFTPTTSNYIVEQCGIILGARGYLREEAYALFQKIKRDVQLVGLFDGSSEVNLYLLATNIMAQAELRKKSEFLKNHETKTIFDFSQEISTFNEQSIQLFTQQLDPIMSSIHGIDCPELDHYVQQIKKGLALLEESLLQQKELGTYIPNSLSAYRQAERYCWLFAASCIINSWIYNKQNLPEPLKKIDWLNLSLEIILHKINGGVAEIPGKLYEVVSADLLWYSENKQLYSLLPLYIS